MVAEPDAEKGEVVRAFIVRKPGAELDEPALMASRSRNATVLVHHRDLSFYDRVGAA